MSSASGRPPGSDSPYMIDQLFDVMANEYRRQLLLALAEHHQDDGAVVRVPDDVAASDADRQTLETELYHAHLPKLADGGFIEWDRETDAVRKGPRFEDIYPVVELLSNYEDELPDDRP